LLLCDFIELSKLIRQLADAMIYKILAFCLLFKWVPDHPMTDRAQAIYIPWLAIELSFLI